LREKKGGASPGEKVFKRKLEVVEEHRPRRRGKWGREPQAGETDVGSEGGRTQVRPLRRKGVKDKDKINDRILLAT